MLNRQIKYFPKKKKETESTSPEKIKHFQGTRIISFLFFLCPLLSSPLLSSSPSLLFFSSFLSLFFLSLPSLFFLLFHFIFYFLSFLSCLSLWMKISSRNSNWYTATNVLPELPHCKFPVFGPNSGLFTPWIVPGMSTGREQGKRVDEAGSGPRTIAALLLRYEAACWRGKQLRDDNKWSSFSRAEI